ncbi:MAG TPA: NADPH-dependent F420 reductase [Mycobacteriales bacterium]|nr:NADPH-dependent F420 reductase [Mycobacteriales bacterium]
MPLPAEGYTIGIIGGTGDQGRGLGRRFALAGHRVVIGSRDPVRASEAAAKLVAEHPDEGLDVTGATNVEAAERAELVIVAVPYEGHRETLIPLAGHCAGKIVIDCVNPMSFDKGGATYVNLDDGSAAEEAAAVLPGARVVSAFHDVSAKRLLGTNLSVSTDVLVCGDDQEAKDVVCEMAAQIRGMRGIDAGPLRLSRHLEALTCVLVGINKTYKTHSGVRITGV